MRLIKGSTARHCNQILNRSGAFWHHESYDHVVKSQLELQHVIAYILNNPVKAGLVPHYNDWQYSYLNPKYDLFISDENKL